MRQSCFIAIVLVFCAYHICAWSNNRIVGKNAPASCADDFADMNFAASNDFLASLRLSKEEVRQLRTDTVLQAELADAYQLKRAVEKLSRTELARLKEILDRPLYDVDVPEEWLVEFDLKGVSTAPKQYQLWKAIDELSYEDSTKDFLFRALQGQNTRELSLTAKKSIIGNRIKQLKEAHPDFYYPALVVDSKSIDSDYVDLIARASSRGEKARYQKSQNELEKLLKREEESLRAKRGINSDHKLTEKEKRQVLLRSVERMLPIHKPKTMLNIMSDHIPGFISDFVKFTSSKKIANEKQLDTLISEFLAQNIRVESDQFANYHKLIKLFVLGILDKSFHSENSIRMTLDRTIAAEVEAVRKILRSLAKAKQRQEEALAEAQKNNQETALELVSSDVFGNKNLEEPQQSLNLNKRKNQKRDVPDTDTQAHLSEGSGNKPDTAGSPRAEENLTDHQKNLFNAPRLRDFIEGDSTDIQSDLTYRLHFSRNEFNGVEQIQGIRFSSNAVKELKSLPELEFRAWIEAIARGPARAKGDRGIKRLRFFSFQGRIWYEVKMIRNDKRLLAYQDESGNWVIHRLVTKADLNRMHKL